MAYHNSSRNNSRRRSGRGRHRGPKRSLMKTIFLTVAMIAVPALGLGLGGLYAYNELGKEKLDTAFCYDRPNQYQTAFFADFSHIYMGSNSQERDLVNILHRTFRGLPPNGKISVFTTARKNTATIVEPSFVLCHPAENTKEQKQLGAPGKSVTVLKRESKEAKERFQKLVANIVNEAKDPEQSATSSPILEQIAAISRYDFNTPLRHLKILSDGVQNSFIGRFCVEKGAMPKFSIFEQKPAYRHIKADLSGVDVEFLMVEFEPLPSKSLKFCTTDEKRRFWVDLAKGSGAKTVRLTPLGIGAAN